MVRRTWWLAALLVAAAVPGVTIGVANGAACARDTAERSGQWFEAKPPLPLRSLGHQVSHGTTQRVRAAAVDPGDRRVVYVADGTRLQRSDDGGCTWREVWTLGPEDAVTEIVSVDVARVAGRTRVLLALVTEVPRPVAAPVHVRVVRSDDGRTGWTTAYETAGVLTAYHGANFVQVRSGAGGSAYVTVPTLAGTVGYAASADGRSWEPRTSPASSDGTTELFGFAVSPWNPAEVYDWGWVQGVEDRMRLRRSTDGARTWQRLDPWPMAGGDDPAWWAVDVAWPRRGAPARVAVVGGTAAGQGFDFKAVVAWSGDGGASFGLAFPPRGSRVSMYRGPVTHTPRGDLVVVAQDGAVLRLPHTGRVPRPGDWRKLASLPKQSGITGVHLGYDIARASSTSPTVLLVPDITVVRLLTVAP